MKALESYVTDDEKKQSRCNKRGETDGKELKNDQDREKIKNQDDSIEDLKSSRPRERCTSSEAE